MTITKSIRGQQQRHTDNLLAKWGICPDTCSWQEYERAKRLYWANYEPEFPNFELFCRFAAKWIGI